MGSPSVAQVSNLAQCGKQMMALMKPARVEPEKKRKPNVINQPGSLCTTAANRSRRDCARPFGLSVVIAMAS